MSNDIALNKFAEPITKLLTPKGVTEFCYNGKNDICFIENKGEWTQVKLDLKGTYSEYFSSLSMLIAAYNEQTFDNGNPLLSGTLPTGERVQIVGSPCADNAMSIRKPAGEVFTLEDYKESGAFDSTVITSEKVIDQEEEQLKDFYKKSDFYNFIKLAVKLRKNIIISGGTSTGKTTFFNAILQLIPDTERLISIEDAREIQFSQSNSLYLIAPKNSTKVTFITLLEACLRLRPDRIMAAEIRGAEAFAYLRAINTGHPGSITTIHANNPMAAFQQIYLMLSQANLGLSNESVESYVKNVVDIVIQLKNVDGRRFISEIYYND